jgi:hypothetical protein
MSHENRERLFLEEFMEANGVDMGGEYGVNIKAEATRTPTYVFARQTIPLLGK